MKHDWETATIWKHPDSDYKERIYSKLTPLWVFLFGAFYWAFRGVWRHFFIIFFAAFFIGFLYSVEGESIGEGEIFILSVFINGIYAFCAKGILRNHYGNKGWTPCTHTHVE